MNVDAEAAAFVSRTLVMIRPACLDPRELELVAASLRYAYAQGYRDSDTLWTLQKICQTRRE